MPRLPQNYTAAHTISVMKRDCLIKRDIINPLTRVLSFMELISKRASEPRDKKYFKSLFDKAYDVLTEFYEKNEMPPHAHNIFLIFEGLREQTMFQFERDGGDL